MLKGSKAVGSDKNSKHLMNSSYCTTIDCTAVHVPYLPGVPHDALIACAILRAQARLSSSALASCPFFTAPSVFCPSAAAHAAAPAAGGGWCWC
eukprot:1143740-Pelagomonas_calceolata.AAC.3